MHINDGNVTYENGGWNFKFGSKFKREELFVVSVGKVTL